MRLATIAPVLLIGFFAAMRAEASILYTTTDLGAGYQFQSDPGDQIHGLTNAAGSVTYAFDKSPVTMIHVYSDLSQDNATGYELLTMQNGSHRVGYYYNHNPAVGFYNAPTFEPFTNGWETTSGLGAPPSPGTGSPVLDVNSGGQVVGVSLLSPSSGQTYAAFSTPDGQSHGFAAAIVDNLNNYIATIPGVTLTSAVKIDDLGRIVAVGSDGNDYLLTPVALGAAATVPEPSTLLMLGLGISWIGLRSFRR